MCKTCHALTYNFWDFELVLGFGIFSTRLQGSCGQITGKMTSLVREDGACHKSIFVVLCTIVQWEGTIVGVHLQCKNNSREFVSNPNSTNICPTKATPRHVNVGPA